MGKMKTLLILFLIAGQCYAQSFIQKKDGSRINVAEGAIRVDANYKRLIYTPYGKEEAKLKFKEIDSAQIGTSVFRVCKIGRKDRGYYVLAKVDGKSLLTMSTIKTRPAGGFESKYMRFEVVIVDSNKNVLYETAFSDESDSNNSARRLDAAAAIKQHFEQCPELLERLSAFELAETDASNAVAKFLKATTFTSCD